MKSVQSDRQWHVKDRLISLWARRKWSWLGWPILVGVALGLLYVLGTAFVAGAESFRIVFLSDELSERARDLALSKGYSHDIYFAIERGNIQANAWLFAIVVGLIALGITYWRINARIQRVRQNRADKKRAEVDGIYQRGFGDATRQSDAAMCTTKDRFEAA